MPPSASTLPSILTGANAPGIAMLALIATESSPLSSTTIFPDSMSVATARNGIGSLSKSCVNCALATSRQISASMSCVASRPPGPLTPPLFTPISSEFV